MVRRSCAVCRLDDHDSSSSNIVESLTVESPLSTRRDGDVSSFAYQLLRGPGGEDDSERASTGGWRTREGCFLATIEGSADKNIMCMHHARLVHILTHFRVPSYCTKYTYLSLIHI